MEKTKNIGLTLTPLSEGSKTFQTFRLEMAGDGSDSNMVIIDEKIGELIRRCAAYDSGPFTWGMLKNGFSSKTSDE